LWALNENLIAVTTRWGEDVPLVVELRDGGPGVTVRQSRR
jgi:hypothetical protein